jgi:hypothetical protein
MNTLDVYKLQCAGINAVELVTGVANKLRGVPPKGIVFHTPGSTWAKGVWDKLNNKSAAVYDRVASVTFDQRNYQPNYLLGTAGLVAQLATDNMRTQHAGRLGADSPVAGVYASDAWAAWASPSSGGGWRLHGRPPRVVYDWWFAAFPGHLSPVTVFPWGESPNDALGIDLLPVVDGTGGPVHTQVQFDLAVMLVKMLANQHGFPINNRTVTTHSLCSPVERGSVLSAGKIIGTPWDLSPKTFDLSAVIRAAQQ